ncbi:MAG: hypothetical protein U0936_10520 [Planctomycetaceae bacterium]
MNFDALSGNRRSRRQAPVVHAPGVIETLENRSLLAAAGPAILSPSGTITNALPFITWQPTVGATSYDLWIADSETRERIVFKEGIPGTSTTLTGAEALHLGMNRLWVRATLTNGTKTDWGAPKDLLLKTTPSVTGPTNPANPANPNRIERNDWAITWNSPVGAKSFEVFLSNQTEQSSIRYTVPNQVELLDAKGVRILDGAGNPILQEVRSFYLNGAVDVIGAAPMTVTGAVNRTFIDITSENHGLVTGNKVRVSGVLGNTGANGDFTVTVISENVFRLDNAVSSGTYTSGRLDVSWGTPCCWSDISTGRWSETASKAIDVTVTNHGLKTGEKSSDYRRRRQHCGKQDIPATVVSANVIRLNGISGSSAFTQNGQLVRLTALQQVSWSWASTECSFDTRMTEAEFPTGRPLAISKSLPPWISCVPKGQPLRHNRCFSGVRCRAQRTTRWRCIARGNLCPFTQHRIRRQRLTEYLKFSLRIP